MKTVVKNWAVVSIKDDLSPFKILWAIVENDERSRFKKGDYVCSSRIIFIENNQVRTHTGSIYELVGLGAEYVASYTQLMELMSGINPAELNLEKK